ncbi:transmembrane protein [Cyclospora cayetanensis]|uniref:Transmembrane protein n=1 Tax=Cyclospora cayetanensis TaxID=88456 RepID=A0A1D3D9A4_9EIME|nr:transmembrane protein [Cyclospora cayetanensis]
MVPDFHVGSVQPDIIVVYDLDIRGSCRSKDACRMDCDSSCTWVTLFVSVMSSHQSVLVMQWQVLFSANTLGALRNTRLVLAIRIASPSLTRNIQCGIENELYAMTIQFQANVALIIRCNGFPSSLLTRDVSHLLHGSVSHSTILDSCLKLQEIPTSLMTDRNPELVRELELLLSFFAAYLFILPLKGPFPLAPHNGGPSSVPFVYNKMTRGPPVSTLAWQLALLRQRAQRGSPSTPIPLRRLPRRFGEGPSASAYLAPPVASLKLRLGPLQGTTWSSSRLFSTKTSSRGGVLTSPALNAAETARALGVPDVALGFPSPEGSSHSAGDSTSSGTNGSSRKHKSKRNLKLAAAVAVATAATAVAAVVTAGGNSSSERPFERKTVPPQQVPLDRRATNASVASEAATGAELANAAGVDDASQVATQPLADAEAANLRENEGQSFVRDLQAHQQAEELEGEKEQQNHQDTALKEGEGAAGEAEDDSGAPKQDVVAAAPQCSLPAASDWEAFSKEESNRLCKLSPEELCMHALQQAERLEDLHREVEAAETKNKQLQHLADQQVAQLRRDAKEAFAAQAEAALSVVEARTWELFEMQDEMQDWLSTNEEKMHAVESQVEELQQEFGSLLWRMNTAVSASRIGVALSSVDSAIFRRVPIGAAVRELWKAGEEDPVVAAAVKPLLPLLPVLDSDPVETAYSAFEQLNKAVHCSARAAFVPEDSGVLMHLLGFFLGSLYSVMPLPLYDPPSCDTQDNVKLTASGVLHQNLAWLSQARIHADKADLLCAVQCLDRLRGLARQESEDVAKRIKTALLVHQVVDTKGVQEHQSGPLEGGRGLARQNLHLRQLELQYWTEVLKKFGTLAAFLGGFASSVMQLQTDIPKGPQGFHLIFSLTAAGAMGLNFLVLAICTTCTVWGPGKALIGQGDESYRVVIGVMEKAYHRSVVFFRMGTLCYFFATVFASLCLFSFLGAMLLSLVLSLVFFCLLKHVMALKEKFVPQKFSSGQLEGNPIRNIGVVMTREADARLSGLCIDPAFGARI